MIVDKLEIHTPYASPPASIQAVNWRQPEEWRLPKKNFLSPDFMGKSASWKGLNYKMTIKVLKYQI